MNNILKVVSTVIYLYFEETYKIGNVNIQEQIYILQKLGFDAYQVRKQLQEWDCYISNEQFDELLKMFEDKSTAEYLETV